MRNSQTFIVLSIIMLMQSLISGFFGPVLLQIMINLHLDQDLVSVLTRLDGSALFNICFICLLCPAYLILAPIVGAYSDKYGRKKYLCGTMIASILGYALIWCSIRWGSIWLLSGSLFLFSLSKIYLPLIMAVITDISIGEKRAWRFGIFHLIMFFMFFSAQFGHILLKKHYEPLDIFINKSLIILIIGEVINFSIAAFILPETRKTIPNSKQLTAHFLLSRVLKIFSMEKIPLFFIWILCISFFWSLYSQLSYNILKTVFHFDYYKISLSMIYNFVIITTAILCVFSFYIKKMSYHFTKTIIYFLIMGFIGSGLFPSSIGQLVFIIPLAGGMIIFATSVITLISKKTDDSDQGLLMGIIAPSVIVMYILSGIVAVKFSNYPVSYSQYAIVACGIFLMGLFLYSGKKLFLKEKFGPEPESSSQK